VSLVFLVGIAIAAAFLLRLETSADDVAYVTVGKDLGAWTASVQSYQFWSGRFALNFLLFNLVFTLLRRSPLGADQPYPAVVVPKNET
jgi:hypothetical protein